MRYAYNGVKGCAIWVIAFVLMIGLANPALAAKTGGGVNHKAKQTPPIQLGASGGWRCDLANGYCCGGTLGSLITDGIKQYILSNFHVFAGDFDCSDGICTTNCAGNCCLQGSGNYIIQPGLIDVSCKASDTNNVATLTMWADPLDNTNIDAAIAEVISGQVRTDGAILEIGTISSATIPASLNQAIKKSSRTTGLTRSKITGLNAKISVSYENECAGSYRGTATFTNQIVIANRGSKFLAAGDSGSLMVEDVASSPRAVGLLYAGSSSVAIANPIQEVLDYFKNHHPPYLAFKMVGGAGTMGAEVPVTEVEKAKKAQARHDARLKRVPGSVGHGVGIGRSGRVVIKVYVEKDTSEARAAVPDSVDGIPVEIEETGKIVPLNCQ